MQASMGKLDSLKDSVLRVVGTVAPRYWALVAFTGYSVWRHYKQYVPIPIYGCIVSFSRILSAMRMSLQGPEGFSRIYSKYPMVLFPQIASWTVLVQPQFVDEITKAPDEVLSFMDAKCDAMQLEYTYGKRFTETQDHYAAIHHHLTRHLTSLFPEMFEEARLTLDESLQTQGDEWRKVHVSPWVLQTVARVSNRIFVGAPLCRDSAWLDFIMSDPAELVLTSLFLNLFPRWIRPIVGPLVAPAERRVRKGVKMVGPLIEERLSMDPSQWPDDFVTSLLINAPESDRTPPEITRRLRSINFASIHTSSLNLGHAIYWLLARPKYVAPLREEIEETVGRLGWTRDAIGQMPKLDSFMKECMRMNPVVALAIIRKARTSFTFSNGVTVPPGTSIAVHLHGTHRDGTIYEHPDEFDGFRFVNQMSKGVDDMEKTTLNSRQTMYTISKAYLAFGHGRHACPGRFFASIELKMLMAYIIVTYDMKWPEEEVPSNLGATEQGYRPPDLWFNFSTIPNPKVHVMFRKRV